MHMKILSAKWWPFCPEGRWANSHSVDYTGWGICYLSYLYYLIVEKWKKKQIYFSCIPRTIQHLKGQTHDDVIKWKHFPRYWPFVRGIHRSPVNSSHKGQRRGALVFSLICAWINGWVNNREAGDLRRQLAHFDVIVMNHLYFEF